MFRLSIIAVLFALALPASATPPIVLSEDVDHSVCGSNTSCIGQMRLAAYESLRAELATICQTRGYNSYHISKGSSRSIGNSVTRMTITGSCRNQ